MHRFSSRATHRPARIALVVLVSAIVLPACALLGDDPDEQIACPAVVAPAVVVEVRNATTGDPEAGDAEGRLIDGDFNESMRVGASNSEGIPVTLEGAYERPGTYTVLIEKEGFESWSRSGVQAEEDECGVVTERITAELAPVQE